MKVLHVVRTSDDQLAHGVIHDLAGADKVEQTLLMIQDGVYMTTCRHRAFACLEDVRSRGIETQLPLVDYDRIAEMIFEHDRVITW